MHESDIGFFAPEYQQILGRKIIFQFNSHMIFAAIFAAIFLTSWLAVIVLGDQKLI